MLGQDTKLFPCGVDWQVINKLDGQYYAVKKILIRKVSKDDCMKVS